MFELTDRLERLEVPTLIMTGDEDEPCLEPSLHMKRKIPTAGLVILPKSGHAINLEEPEAFNRAVLDFVAAVDAGRWAPDFRRRGSGERDGPAGLGLRPASLEHVTCIIAPASRDARLRPMDVTLLQDFETLRQRLRPHVQRARRAIVFGSVARGEADAGSDLDLVIVADTPRPFFDRFRDFTGVWDVWPRLDLLVYTPAEFEQMRAEGNPFIEQVLAEGRVVHEAAEA